MSAERDIADALTSIARVLDRLEGFLDFYFSTFGDEHMARRERAAAQPRVLTTGTMCPGGCGQLPHEGPCFRTFRG